MSRPRLGTVALTLLAVAVVGAASFDSIRKAPQRDPPAQQPQAAVVHGVALGDRALLTAQLQIDGVDGVSSSTRSVGCARCGCRHSWQRLHLVTQVVGRSSRRRRRRLGGRSGRVTHRWRRTAHTGG